MSRSSCSNPRERAARRPVAIGSRRYGALAFMGLVALLAPGGLAQDLPQSAPGSSRGRTRTTVERLSVERLRGAHRDVEKLRSLRRELPPLPGLHRLPGDLPRPRLRLRPHGRHARRDPRRREGRGRARSCSSPITTGRRATSWTGWRGVRDGVLFVPGAEIGRGSCCTPRPRSRRLMDAPEPELLAAVDGGEGSGIAFLSHLEERRDHSLDGAHRQRDLQPPRRRASDDELSMRDAPRLDDRPRRRGAACTRRCSTASGRGLRRPVGLPGRLPGEARTRQREQQARGRRRGQRLPPQPGVRGEEDRRRYGACGHRWSTPTTRCDSSPSRSGPRLAEMRAPATRRARWPRASTSTPTGWRSASTQHPRAGVASCRRPRCARRCGRDAST